MRVEGLSVPYSIPADNIMSVVLMVCALLSIMIVMRSNKILLLRIRALFIRTTNLSNYRHTIQDSRDELFLTGVAVLSMALLSYSTQMTYFYSDHILQPYIVMLIYAGIFTAFFMLKKLLYMLTIPVYCTIPEWRTWKYTFRFIPALYGLLILPITLIHIYLRLSFKITLILVFTAITIGLFTKIYNAWSIFFRRKRLYVPFFLYLCTLEIAPLALLAGTLLSVAEALKG